MPRGITTSHERIAPPPTPIARVIGPLQESAEQVEKSNKVATLVGLVCLSVLGFGAFSAGLGLTSAGLAAAPLKILMVPGVILCASSVLTFIPVFLAIGVMLDLYKQYMNSRAEAAR